ncbi:hypothetical protein MMUR_27360 [Mycolicibacterium murale]|jgi:hypothetical protein|uniref:Uncharacterized protein n=1 Tax=Mycolicibacterium murale TaxID=182220 RepID=A0A7I9WMN4_9MYCO|nr:hypothetical protein [Mycolicibacterium murale]MCV7181198.1 hypothetical protein [Mycolicibacterium murale]GFG58600.1 hypothetical protein MMUR_27360 [Mycolicibacterium murale]
MVMRRISGTVVMPPDAPVTTAAMVLELRDTSWADAQAPQIAVASFPDTAVSPGRRQHFAMQAPETSSHQHLSLQCQISLAGSQQLGAGDLVSVESIPVASAGDVTGLTVRVVAV